MIISPSRYVGAPFPTVAIDEYQSWTNQAQHLFTGLAFYQPALSRLNVARHRTAELSVATASDNLFELLNIPVSSRKPEHSATLILSRAAWRKYFDADPHIVGRVLEVAGQQALVAGIISEDSWQLPGRMDAWLLEDEQHLAALPSHSKGFVLAHIRTSAFHPWRDGRWHMSVPNEAGGSDTFECVSLSERMWQPFVAFLLTIGLACLVLPATTSLSLGDYPANSHSPRWAIRLRRWIFLSTKIALVLPVLYCGLLYWVHLNEPHGSIPIHALLVEVILAFRWILIDQRKRCPVCLRLLTNPARVGQRAQNFLGWNGTELMCVRGHGLLHVPEFPTSWFSTQRWLYLDPSWSGLFS